jgi:hypothetical protein
MFAVDITNSTLIAIILIVSMHIFYIGLAKKVDRIWPSWSTAAGGFAVGYVFLLLLPKLSVMGGKGMEKYPDYPMLGLSIIYLFVLLGFVSYWLVDLLGTDDSPTRSYWRQIQSASFFLYNVLIGEFVVANLSFIPTVYFLSLFTIIFHLAGMNHLFHHWHPHYFQHRMRWIFAAGILIGAIGGYLAIFSWKVIGLVTAFMGGAILINVIYYEMPHSRDQKRLPFLVGILAFVLVISFARYITQS